jgi:hypothetical protein
VSTTNPHELNNFIMVCKECMEFCDDYKRLLTKVPFKNCNKYKNAYLLGLKQKQRLKSAAIDSTLRALPFMSKQARQIAMDRIFPAVPKHAILH